MNFRRSSTKWWDNYFIGLAKYISKASKDPSTKVGSVIVDSSKRVISVGYNGFPKGIKDLKKRLNDREWKYLTVVHAERNALLFARQSLEGCSIYTYPFFPCSVCASMIIQTGIKRCIAPKLPKQLIERWEKNIALSIELFKEAKVEVVEFEVFDENMVKNNE